MPNIAGRLPNNLKIMVYISDQSHGPHVHVAYKGQERARYVQLAISDGSFIGGRLDAVKRPDLRNARKWLEQNRAFAMAQWLEINPPIIRSPRRTR